jgi:hypothetical protein
LVFKSIRIDNGKIKKMELYEPFKGLYEGVRIKCKLQEIQGLAITGASVSTLLPTDGRWEHSHRTILSFLHTIYDEIFVSNEAYLRWVTN